MKIESISNSRVTCYEFSITNDDRKYRAIIYCNAKGKFIDESITDEDGQELDMEGEQGELRETILNCIDGSWEDLIET